MKDRKRHIHYGWVIVFCGFLMIFYGIGLIVNAFSVFLEPLIEELQISKTSASSLSLMRNLGGLITLFFSSFLYKKYGVRMIASVGGLAVMAGYLILSFAKDLTGCYVGFFIVGCGYGLSGMVPASILI